MHIFFSAGEPSGDQHAAGLMSQLKRRHPNCRLSGYGGPEMTQAGLECHYQLTDLAVMGIAGVLPLLRTFWSLYRQAAEFLKSERPDAVVLVDFPGFNWWIAKAAKAAGIPVYFYCPPQLWAWAPWRIRKMRKLVDCVLSVLPFEAEWYRKRNMPVEYVGHPFFDEVAAYPLNPDTIAHLHSESSRLVGLLPGSRKQEVNRNFPMMLDIVAELHRRHPTTRFAVACYKQWHHERCREILFERGQTLPIDLYVSRTPEVIEAADCCLMVSGSVSLELLARRTPAVVVYRAGALTYFLGQILATCRYMTLPNLIANSPIMPEFPCLTSNGAHVSEMTEILSGWIEDDDALRQSRETLGQLADQIVQRGGVAKAAEVLSKRIVGEEPIRLSRAA